MRPPARTLLILLAPLLLVAALLATPDSATQELTTSEATDHVGEKATVCGEVVSTHYAASSRGRPTFLNLDEPYPDPVFTVVIWGDHRSKFRRPPEDHFRDERICVTGQITSYRGVPQIEVDDPDQIELRSEEPSGDSPSRTTRRQPNCRPRSDCCRICRKGKACGDSCISRSYTCHEGRGCACNSWEVCREPHPGSHARPRHQGTSGPANAGRSIFAALSQPPRPAASLASVPRVSAPQ